MDVDVLGLQEVDSGYHVAGADQIRFLAHASGMEAVAGPTLRSTVGHYGNALLSRHRTTAIRRVNLSVAGKEPRGALDVELAVGDWRVQVVVTHLGLRRFERVKQVE